MHMVFEYCGWTPRRKHVFDVFVICLLAAVLVPVLIFCAFAIFLLEGRPIFYVSKRRVYGRHTVSVLKFRTMRRDAERIANRNTVPVTSIRFLNLPIDSPLYTPIGRWIERLMLTELPQIYHVLLGQMSLVGNRPLPENVIASLREVYPYVEQRFGMPAGLTGPAQLVGRDAITDADRLRLEIAYCQVVAESYSMWLDLRILFHTVLVGLLPGYRFSPDQVLRLMSRTSAGGRWQPLGRHLSLARRRRPASPPMQAILDAPSLDATKPSGGPATIHGGQDPLRARSTSAAT